MTLKTKLAEIKEALQQVTPRDWVWAGRLITALTIDVWAVVTLVGVMPIFSQETSLYYVGVVVALSFGMIGIMSSNPSKIFVSPIFDHLDSVLEHEELKRNFLPARAIS